MNPDSDPALQSLLAHYRSMPPVAAMRLEIAGADAAGLHADVFVASSEVRYRAPLFADLEAVAEADAAELAAFVATLRGNGRASLDIAARVPLPEGGRACDMRSRYVAIARG
jgi:hypothetical protein